MQAHPEKTALCPDWQAAQQVAECRQVGRAFISDGAYYGKKRNTKVRKSLRVSAVLMLPALDIAAYI